MEAKDEALIQKLISEHEELRLCWEEHQKFEQALEEFNQRKYLTPEETMERKRIQKLKLAGRDRMEEILARFRQEDVF
jgi:hypothetical protein